MRRHFVRVRWAAWEALESRALLSVQLFQDFVPGTFGSEPWSFFPHGGDVYFSAVSGEYGRELWKTDGTPAGTGLVKDLVPGPASSYANPIASVGGRLLFAAFSRYGVDHYSLYTTDGTDAGTVLFNPPGLPAGDASPMAQVGDVLYFSASDRSVWRTDGTLGGTTPLPVKASANRGSRGSVATPEGTVYFAATDADGGDEPWLTDGTPEGTRRIKDTLPGPAGPVPA